MKWLRIPLVEPGMILPLGLSRHTAGGYRLRLPLLIWFRRGYRIEWDEMARGWWRFDVSARFELHGITVRWGWMLVRRVERAQ